METYNQSATTLLVVDDEEFNLEIILEYLDDTDYTLVTAANGQAGAFGAKVFVYEAGSGQTVLLGMRESRSNQGYLSQDSPVLHFGLGGIDTMVDVVVQYVDGSQTTCVDADVNLRLRIDETAADPCNP